MKKPLLILVVLLVLAGIYVLFMKKNSSTPRVTVMNNGESTNLTFATPKKSAHYESNTPTHGTILAAVPINVVIDFNFDLAKPSFVKIEKDGTDYGVGETIIDTNKLAMRHAMDPAASDGIYTAIYNACWPDGSCHDGSFQFAIAKDQAKNAVDMRNQKAVEIRLKSIMFAPKDIMVSRGTTITWINDDEVEHYVNTDSHPAHTYHPEQNSQALKKGDTYSITLATPGIYPYHCSAHADSMIGSIIVE